MVLSKPCWNKKGINEWVDKWHVKGHCLCRMQFSKKIEFHVNNEFQECNIGGNGRSERLHKDFETILMDVIVLHIYW